MTREIHGEDPGNLLRNLPENSRCAKIEQDPASPVAKSGENPIPENGGET